MIFPEIKKLYKYSSVSENSLGILIKDEFWFSKPEKFNDPLDCGIQLIESADKDTILKVLTTSLSDIEITINKEQNKQRIVEHQKVLAATKFLISRIQSNITNQIPAELLKQLGNTFSKKYSKEIQKIGILSLSELNDNILMWSHYADQHKGICIELDRFSDSDLSDNELTLPVRYSIKKPLISLKEEGTATAKEKKEIRRSLIYTKSVDWSYEREWRVVKPEGNKSYKINTKITAIIFGIKTPLSTIKTIVELIKKPNRKLI